MSEQIYNGPSQMARIDGTKVRSLREAKGLTQLYIATVVGVTTDTISRWENRRYPSIKVENALKLAEALEVTLEDILEKEPETAPLEPEPADKVSFSRPPKASRILLWLMLLAIVLLLPFIWFRFNRQPEPVLNISASRLLPPHTPVDQPFPVIIKVENRMPGSSSLILRERLPDGCMPIVSDPHFTGIDNKTGHLKWIVRTSGQVTTFVYLAKVAADGTKPAENKSLHFNGTVTLRDERSSEATIGGSQELPIANYHWADANRNNRIEDEEILAVYDSFSALDNVGYDWQEIDAIWSAEGYDWDGSSGKFVIRR